MLFIKKIKRHSLHSLHPVSLRSCTVANDWWAHQSTTPLRIIDFCLSNQKAYFTIKFHPPTLSPDGPIAPSFLLHCPRRDETYTPSPPYIDSAQSNRTLSVRPANQCVILRWKSKQRRAQRTLLSLTNMIFYSIQFVICFCNLPMLFDNRYL